MLNWKEIFSIGDRVEYTVASDKNNNKGTVIGFRTNDGRPIITWDDRNWVTDFSPTADQVLRRYIVVSKSSIPVKLTHCSGEYMQRLFNKRKEMLYGTLSQTGGV